MVTALISQRSGWDAPGTQARSSGGRRGRRYRQGRSCREVRDHSLGYFGSRLGPLSCECGIGHTLSGGIAIIHATPLLRLSALKETVGSSP